MSTEQQEVSCNKEDIEKLRRKLSLCDHKISVALYLHRHTFLFSKDDRFSDCPDYVYPPEVSDEDLREYLFKEFEEHEKLLNLFIKQFESLLYVAKR